MSIENVENKVKAEVYVPAVAKFSGDLSSRHQVLEPAIEKGFSTGFMLVILKPEDLRGETLRRQFDNLDPYVAMSGSERPAVFIMHPWKPLTGTADKPLNLLTNPSWSVDYIQESIQMAALMPRELVPQTGRAVSFHLSSYVMPDKWNSDPEYWQREFETVNKHLQEIASYGKRWGVNVHVENVPVPAWGDWAVSDDSKIPNTDYHFRDLGTPWPGLPWRKEIQDVRNAGLAWTIDVCHMHTAIRGVKEAYRLINQKGLTKSKVLDSYMIFDSDLGEAHRAIRNFSDVVLGVVKDGDILHVNQTTGKYLRKELHGKDQPYGDSASLTDPKGNIPQQHLDRIIKDALQRPVKFVLEINEPKGKMEEAPNTRASLDYILKVAQGL